MKAITVSILVAAVAVGPAAMARDQQGKEEVGLLRQALAAAAATADPQGPKPPDHFNAKADNDRGDDKANPGAILRVCSKETPAAHRSAICPTGISPD